MSPTEASQRADDARPLILVAEREPIAYEGLRLMDVAVFLYRLRWRVLVAWIACGVFAAFFASAQAPFEWRMEIDCQPPEPQPQPQSQSQSQSQLQPQRPSALEPVARMANEWPDITCEFGKITVSGKAEVIRTHLSVSAKSASDNDPPKSIVSLRSQANAWIADQAKRYLERQADTVLIARERLKAVSQDASATAIDRAAATLALAQAESALKFPPVWEVGEFKVESVPPARIRDWATRGLGSFAAALALVLLFEGWSRVRAADRAQLSR